MSSDEDAAASFRRRFKNGRYSDYIPVPVSESGLVEPFEDAATSLNPKPVDVARQRRRTSYLAQLPEDASWCERWLAGEYTIIPEENRGLDVWDTLVIAALVCTALVLPFEVAFFRDTPLCLWILGRIVDVIFVMDIVVTFQVAYTVPNALTNDMYERAPLKIARHYLSVPCSDGGTGGWFWPDLLTVLPWDFFGVESIRLLRVLRLLRMMRLVRVIKLCNRWHSRVGTSYAFLNICKCAVVTLVTLHWLTCVWGFMGLASRASESETWLKLYAVKTQADVDSFNIYEVYNLSMYFCAMTLTGVGFGDVSPSGQFEIQLSTVTMFVTGFMWAWVIANVVNVVNNLDAYFTHFQKLNDDLNMLMESRGLSPSLQLRARKHLHEAFKVHRQRHQQNTIRALSIGLQGEIALQSGADRVCNCVWYLRDVDPDVLVELVNYFVPDMYSPGEYIIHKQAVSVIRRGSCWFKGRILMRDSIMGEDMLLDSDYLRDAIFPKTLNYVEVMTLQRDDLQQVCEKFPEFSRKIRMAQIRLAFRRGFIFYSRQMRVLKSLPGRITREEIRRKALPARDQMKSPRFFTTNDRHTQLCNVVSELREAFESNMDDMRMRQAGLAEQIGRLEPPAAAEDSPASPRQLEQLAGTAPALQDSTLSVRLAELEAAQLRLAERVGTLAEQQAQVIELNSRCGQDQAAALSGEGKLPASQPMHDLMTPPALLEAVGQANPGSSHDVGEQDLMERSSWSVGPSGDIGGTSPFKFQRHGMAGPSWAEALLARLDAIEKGLSHRHDALEASLARQLRHSEDIERKLAECPPSRWTEASSGGSEAVPDLHQLKQFSDNITDSLAAMFARQQSLLEVGLASYFQKCNDLQESILALQSRLAEPSGHTANDLTPFNTIDIGEVASQRQFHMQLEVDDGRLAKTIRQRGLSLETAVSAQLMDFGTALRQRTEAQLDMLREAAVDLVKRQSETLQASLAMQLGYLEADCLQGAQRLRDDCSKQREEGRSPVSRSPSHACSPVLPARRPFNP